MICGYGVAIWCALSFLSHIAGPEYFEFDSKGATIPVKTAAHNNPKMVGLTLLISATIGAIAHLIGKRKL